MLMYFNELSFYHSSVLYSLCAALDSLFAFRRKHLLAQSISSAIGEPQDAGVDRLDAPGPPLWIFTPRN